MFYRGDILTVAEFNAKTGNSSNIISNNIQLDPKFINAIKGNFHLEYFSPAIDNGVFVGLTMDFDGITVPQGTQVDIGAFEFH